MIVSHRVFLKIRNISGRRCGENENTHFMLNKFSENCAIYEIMWENMIQQEKEQMTVQYSACTLHAG
jgi:hypothetical protein